MSGESFLGVRLKSQRAFSLLRSLEEDSERWASTVNIELRHSFDDGGWHVWSAGPLPAPPAEFGIRVGEIAYQLRSAMDHAAHEIIFANGAKPTKNTYFPISLTEHAWNSQSKPYLKGASEASMSVAKSWQPFIREPEVPQRDMLAAINEIALVDKHRRLMPVAAGLGFRQIKLHVDSPQPMLRKLAVQNRDESLVDLSTTQWVIKARVSHAGSPDVPDLSSIVHVEGASSVVTAAVQFRTHFPYEINFGLTAFARMARHARRVLLELERSV